jgi:hypothetical protein
MGTGTALAKPPRPNQTTDSRAAEGVTGNAY